MPNRLEELSVNYMVCTRAHAKAHRAWSDAQAKAYLARPKDEGHYPRMFAATRASIDLREAEQVALAEKNLAWLLLRTYAGAPALEFPAEESADATRA